MLRQREPRVENHAFLAFVRLKACCVCGAPPPSQAAHIRMSSLDYGKRETGAGEKASDRWTTPQCASCHLVDQHGGSERAFWARVGVDPFALASDLYKAFVAANPGKSPSTVNRPAYKRPRVNVSAYRPKRKWASRPFPAGRKFSDQRRPT